MKKSTLFLALASVVALGATAREMQTSSALLQNAQVNKAVVQPGIQTEAIKIQNSQKTGRKISPKSEVSAKYTEPEGLYTIGMTNTLSGYSYAFRFGPAFKEITWLNASEGANDFTWEFQDPNFEEEDFLTTNSTDLTLMYPWSSIDGPILHASDGTTTSTYDRQEQIGYCFGGDTKISPDGTKTFGVTTYDAPYYKNAQGYGYASTGVGSYDTTDSEYYTSYGTYTGWEEALKEDYELEATDEVHTKSFINVFPKPASTISVSKVWAWINATATEETTLNAALVKINDENQITNDTIAYGIATIPAGGATVVEWELYTVDEDGFENYGRVNINSSFAVCIYGFDENPALTSITFVSGNGHVFDRSVEKFNFPINAYMEFEVIREGASFGHLIESSPYIFYVDKQNYPSLFWGVTDFMVMVDAETWWLATEDETEYNFPEEGGSHDFTMWGHYAHGDVDDNGNEIYWNVEPVDPEADTDWLEVSIDNEYYNNGKEDIYDGTIVSFTAEELPEGVAGRAVDVKVSYPGAELILKLSQGDAGVKGVEVKSAQYVNVVGNDFVVKATSDVTKAEVYTAAGVKVAEAAVNGTATINAAGLAHGVYFVKLNNGKTVKVVK